MPETEPATSKGFIQAHFLQALKMHFSDLNYRQALVRVWRMQLCSHRYVRITRLLSAPLVLRIGDWLCILPAITLVVDKSKKVNKAASSHWTGEQLNPQDGRHSTVAFPLGGERGHFIQSRVEFSHLIVLCIQCCVRATNTSVNSFTSIAFSALHVDLQSVNIAYTIHNSITLILCIDYLNMPFNVHTTDKVTMITVSGFLTI